MARIDITCHCGALAQPLTLAPAFVSAAHQAVVELRSSSAYRHMTGLLAASYVPISDGRPANLDASRRYQPSAGEAFYFCRVCGCHVFRERDAEWAVATGVIVDSNADTRIRFGSQTGGDVEMLPLDQDQPPSPSLPQGDSTEQPTCHLPATCHCRTVSFTISRPDASSHAPHSPFPDLMIPYATSSPQIANADDAKWWLRSSARYLAGLCACRSCRLTAGFEIQPWAFVPRRNISFSSSSPAEQSVRASFDDLHQQGVLQGYQSSEGVVREFCPQCGATVFWHDGFRPDLLDVSVGLLDQDVAGPWLDWWTERVSFAEEAGRGRKGVFADGAVDLVARLAARLRREQHGAS